MLHNIIAVSHLHWCLILAASQFPILGFIMHSTASAAGLPWSDPNWDVVEAQDQPEWEDLGWDVLREREAAVRTNKDGVKAPVTAGVAQPQAQPHLMSPPIAMSPPVMITGTNASRITASSTAT